MGFRLNNPRLFHQAFTPRGSKQPDYERLEFLGDAILGSVISAHLFHLYPEAKEGKLSQLKSKIVNRKTLNEIGSELNLSNWIQHYDIGYSLSENISGNLLEAMIGAIYLDQGYARCEGIILKKILSPDRIAFLQNRILSYKGLLLEWSQKHKRKILYQTVEERLPHQPLCFRTEVFLDKNKVATARDSSKKKAEEKAAQRVFYALNLKEKP